MPLTRQQRRINLISGIRALADFLERNPVLPVPDSLDVLAFPASRQSYATRRAEVDRVAKAIGAEVKDNHGHYTAQVEFGRVQYRVVAISEEAMARHEALMSNQHSVLPDTDTRAGTASRSLRIPHPDAYGGRCPCGALADKGTHLCRKCRSRGRWNRRKAASLAEGEDE